MARQNSAITIIGKLGNMHGMQYRGLIGTFAALNGGADRDTILNSPNFVRTRENMTEFGGVSKAAKDIRLGLGAQFSDIASPYAGSQFVQAMKKIQLGSGGIRGERQIDFLTGGTSQLIGLQINRNNTFSNVCSIPYTTAINTQSLTVDFTATTTVPVSPPPGATHYRLFGNITYVANYDFDPNQGYIPTDPNSGQGITEFSTFYPVGDPYPGQTLIAGLLNTTTGCTLGTVGIEFFQEVAGVFYRLEAGAAAGIEIANAF